MAIGRGFRGNAVTAFRGRKPRWAEGFTEAVRFVVDQGSTAEEPTASADSMVEDFTIEIN